LARYGTIIRITSDNRLPVPPGKTTTLPLKIENPDYINPQVQSFPVLVDGLTGTGL